MRDQILLALQSWSPMTCSLIAWRIGSTTYSVATECQRMMTDGLVLVESEREIDGVMVPAFGLTSAGWYEATQARGRWRASHG